MRNSSLLQIVLAAFLAMGCAQEKVPVVKTQDFLVVGMICTACPAKAHDALTALPGVKTVEVRYPDGDATVTYDAATLSEEGIVKAIEGVGFGAKAIPPSKPTAP